MVWGNESVVLWNVGERTGCLILPGISISSNLSLDERRGSPTWCGDVMEIRAGILTKRPLWRSFHILYSLYFESIFIYYYLSPGSQQRFVVEYRALDIQFETTCVEYPWNKKRLNNITISHFHKSICLKMWDAFKTAAVEKKMTSCAAVNVGGLW